MPRLIDLHCHLIPGVDDGPANGLEAGELLDRIKRTMPRPSVVFATPHMRLSHGARRLAFLEGRFEDFLRSAPASGDGGLLLGASVEVMLDGYPFRSRDADALCYPGTNWILVEVPPRLPWFVAFRRVDEVSRKGFRPLLAHPERYRFHLRRGAMEKLVRSGAALQVSTRSLASADESLRESAWAILLSGWCSVLASDCHSARDPLLPESEAEVTARMGRDAWIALGSLNPERILAGQAVEPVRAGA